MEVEQELGVQESESESAPLRPVAVDPARETVYTAMNRTVAAFEKSEGGAADLFAHLYGDNVRYDHARKRWLIWDQHRWAPDKDGNVNRLMRQLADRIRFAGVDRALIADDDKRAEALAKWGFALNARSKHDSVLAMVRSVEPVADAGEDWDATPGLLGVPNGVVDLKTGELRDGQQADRITKQAGVEYDPAATCPRWERFVREVLDDEATIEYVQKLAGYSLTGEASEDKLIFLMGIGGNGKTTLLNVLRVVAGDYAQEVSAMAILEERAGAHTTEVADLEGSRLATCEEIGDAKLNANRLKQISGGSPITARKMRENTTTFEPTWQLWITTNGLPKANDNARAFWRRVVAIDFPNIFQQSDDPQLEDDLKRELPGILTWLIRGAVEYYANGLGEVPESVAAHTAAYRQDTDPLQPAFDAGFLVEDPDAWTPSAILHGAYLRWAAEAEVLPQFRLGSKGFSQALSGRCDPSRKQIEGKELRGFAGVKVGEGR